MKKLLKLIGALLLFLVILGCGLYFWMLITIDWEESSRKSSPDNRLTAFHMQSKSEAGAAPYGDHIVLVPKYKLLGQYFIEPVFAAYCKQLEYKWVDDYTLLINCDGEQIKRKSLVFNDVKIVYITEVDN